MLCEIIRGTVIRMSTLIKTYSELMTISSYIERFRYLKLTGQVGIDTFGHDRYLNQILYNTPEWKRFRRDIIIRDNGCDLGHEDYEIYGKIMIHHINPITADDILRRDPKIFDPENVISCTMMTHNAIHYGSEDLLMTGPIERRPNDTCPWRRS